MTVMETTTSTLTCPTCAGGPPAQGTGVCATCGGTSRVHLLTEAALAALREQTAQAVQAARSGQDHLERLATAYRAHLDTFHEGLTCPEEDWVGCTSSTVKDLYAAIERALALAATWRYKGEVLAPGQIPQGPDPASAALDRAANQLHAALDGDDQEPFDPDEHFPWHYTEFGVLCACGRPMRGEVCPAQLAAPVEPAEPPVPQSSHGPQASLQPGEPAQGPGTPGGDPGVGTWVHALPFSDHRPDPDLTRTYVQPGTGNTEAPCQGCAGQVAVIFVPAGHPGG